MTDVTEKTIGEQLSELLIDDDVVYVSYFNKQQIRETINILSKMKTQNVVFNLNKDDAREAFNHFSVASQISEMVHDDNVKVYISDKKSGSSIIKTDEIVNIMYGNTVYGTVDDIDVFRDEVKREIEQLDTHTFKTPPLNIFVDEITKKFNNDVSSTFMDLFEHASTHSEKVDDGAILMLLSGTIHEKLLYDIALLGENTGLASRATFSRYKSKLEENDILTTKKVPRDIGRPRQRLVLTDNMKGLSNEEIIEYVDSEF